MTKAVPEEASILWQPFRLLRLVPRAVPYFLRPRYSAISWNFSFSSSSNSAWMQLVKYSVLKQSCLLIQNNRKVRFFRQLFQYKFVQDVRRECLLVWWWVSCNLQTRCWKDCKKLLQKSLFCLLKQVSQTVVSKIQKRCFQAVFSVSFIQIT